MEQCDPSPSAVISFAIEEGEAWLLGEISAVKAAYPNAKNNVLNSYVNDSICGTWEVLADATVSGGAEALRKAGWQAIGAEKSKWADEITPRLKIVGNKSPSFTKFVDSTKALCANAE